MTALPAMLSTRGIRVDDAHNALGALRISQTQESVVNAPASQSTLRPGGLAAWQAKRTVAYIEANLGSKMAIREMADLLALSENHFSRAFRTHPHDIGAHQVN